MAEIIQLTDELRIRRLDRMNVTVERLFEKKDGSGREWDQANHSGRGPFFTNEAAACAWVLDSGLMSGVGEADLAGAIADYRKIADNLVKAVRKEVGR